MYLTGAFVLLASNALALGFLALCRRWQASGWLRPSNEVVGYYAAVLGTLYAVVVACMLYAVWNENRRLIHEQPAPA